MWQKCHSSWVRHGHRAPTPFGSQWGAVVSLREAEAAACLISMPHLQIHVAEDLIQARVAERNEVLFLHPTANCGVEFPCQERKAEETEDHPSPVAYSWNRGIALGSRLPSLPLAPNQWHIGFAHEESQARTESSKASPRRTGFVRNKVLSLRGLLKTSEIVVISRSD